MRASTFALACLLSTSSWGCEPESTSRTQPEPVAHQHTGDKRSVPSAAPHPAECGSECGAANDPSGHGCGHEAPPRDDPPRTRQDPLTGATVTAVGGELKGAQAVGVSDLAKDPERFAGKTVQVRGDVTAMCTHRRAWFAVREHPSDAHFVRVVTAPSFLVPPHAVGRKARAEGRVDVIEVPERAARHYARDHQLGDPSEVRGSRKSVVIRATGAEFL
jgi:hypothetical protein